MSARLPLEPPFLVQKGGRWYFVDPDGAAWRITDTLYERQRHRELTIGAAEARYRCFVAPDKTRRIYEFKPGDLRRLDEDNVARQLRESKHESPEKPDPRALSLGDGERRTPTFADVPHSERGAEPGGSTPPSNADRRSGGTGKGTRPKRTRRGV